MIPDCRTSVTTASRKRVGLLGPCTRRRIKFQSVVRNATCFISLSEDELLIAIIPNHSPPCPRRGKRAIAMHLWTARFRRIQIRARPTKVVEIVCSAISTIGPLPSSATDRSLSNSAWNPNPVVRVVVGPLGCWMAGCQDIHHLSRATKTRNCGGSRTAAAAAGRGAESCPTEFWRAGCGCRQRRNPSHQSGH